MYKIIGANQSEYGPATAEQVRQWIAEGRIHADTLAQAVGETAWKPIASFPDFAASFPAAAPPPAAAASPISTFPNPDGRARALQEVNGPAIGLMITGVLGVGYGLLSVLGNMFGFARDSFTRFGSMNLPAQNAQMLRMMQMSSGTLGVVLAVLKVGLGVLVFYGALKMKELANHNLCIVVSILALIPCISPCCCVGLPIGIWALVVLNRSDVRGYFS